MPAVDPHGGQAYWFDGASFDGLLLTGNDAGEQKFWFDGASFAPLIAAPSPVGTAAGTSTVVGVGRATVQRVGSSAGVGSASGVGHAIANAVGSAAGAASANASAFGSSSAVGSAAGVATVTAVGGTVKPTAGASAGSSTVTAVGRSGTPATGAGSSTGVGAAHAVSNTAIPAVGSAHGVATVTGHIVAINLGPHFVTLNPTVVIDGWSGYPIYFWEQLYGPDTATIASPFERVTAIGFPETRGGYVFQLSVTTGSFVSKGLYRVTVHGTETEETPELTGLVTLTIGSDEFLTKINTVSITESLGDASNKCSFSIFDVPVPVCKEIILTRDGRRLYAGLALNVVQSDFERLDETTVYATYNVVATGYEWYFQRRYVNKTYDGAWSATTIALDLVSLVPGFTTTGIRSGLPMLVDFVAKGAVGAVLSQLGDAIDCHWRVDYFRDVKLTNYEDPANDPQPLSESTLSKFRGLAVTADITQAVTRVYVSGSDSGAVYDPDWNHELEVDSLEGYDSTGGDTLYGGKPIHYTGTRSGYKYGMPLAAALTFQITGLSYNDPSGRMEVANGITYAITISSSVGESGIISSAQLEVLPGHNALKVKVLAGMPLPGTLAYKAAQQISSITLYRYVNFGGFFKYRAVANFSNIGGVFVDLKSNLDTDWATAKTPEDNGFNAVDEPAYFLTGVTGTPGPIISSHKPVAFTEQVDNFSGQAVIAALLGGGDDGVISDSIDIGESTRDNARQVGLAYLAPRGEINAQISYSTEDPDSHPGQIVSAFLTHDAGVEDDFKIQQVQITGFERGVAENYQVTASKRVNLTRFGNIFRKLLSKA